MTDERKQDVKKLIMTIACLAVSVALLASSIFAWLTISKEVSAGIGFVADIRNIEIGEEITVIRTLTSSSGSNVVTSVFKQDTDGEYYEYDDVNDVWIYEESGEKRVISIRGLLPNESIDFIVPILRSSATGDLSYSMSMSNLYSEMFYHDYMQDDLQLRNVHSMLEVIKISWLEEDENGDYVPTSATPQWILTYGSTDADGSHYIASNLAEYEIFSTGEGDDDYEYIKIDSIPIVSGTWTSEQETLVIAFRLTFDTAQISGLALTNVLSLKRLIIGQIRIVAG